MYIYIYIYIYIIRVYIYIYIYVSKAFAANFDLSGFLHAALPALHAEGLSQTCNFVDNNTDTNTKYDNNGNDNNDNNDNK